MQDLFFHENGEKRNKKIALAVMDMSQAFQLSVKEHVPKAMLFFDKFHVMQKLCNALDEVRFASQPGESGSQRPEVSCVAPQSEQAAPDCLPSQGIIRSILDVPFFGVGAEVLRALERITQVAVAQTTRRICCDGGSPLGWHRCPSHNRGYSSRLRRRTQQQDPRHPTTCLQSA